MEIAVGDRHPVGDHHIAPDDDALRTHEHPADDDGPVADLQEAGRLHIEGAPGIDLDAGAEDETRIASAPEAIEDVRPFQVAPAADVDVGWQPGAVPSSG